MKEMLTGRSVDSARRVEVHGEVSGGDVQLILLARSNQQKISNMARV